MKKDNFAAMQKNVDDIKKQVQTNQNKNEYMYYSRILKEPFATLPELKEAEEAYYAKLKAKEDKAAQKKADAKKVEDAFVALNAARKAYKEDLNSLASEYSENLVALKDAFEAACADVKARMAKAEDNYSAAIKTFTEKYPEGYHLTLKDGDFETTISGSNSTSSQDTNVRELLSWLFNV